MKNKNVRMDDPVSSKNKMNQPQNIYDDIVYGRNSVLELLKSDKDINKILISRGEKHRFY